LHVKALIYLCLLIKRSRLEYYIFRFVVKHKR
jgi:hypothetical protein